MAEALVSFLIENMGSIALESIGQEVRLVKGVEEDVAKLKTNLQDIEVLLEDAEQKQLNDAGVRRWLEKLKKASHHMDDVLDEWNTDILEYKIKKEEEAENNASFPNKKVRLLTMPSFPLFFSKVDRLTMRRDIALKIKKLNADLDRIAKDKEIYGLDIKRVVERPEFERRQTTFLVDETKVLGRDKEKSLLISKLLCESSDDGRPLDIIPIVGMGGLGKTTLAQLAYNHETIKTHFDKQIWVCVSDPFEETKIAKEIISGLGSSLPHPCTLNTLVQRIHESIEGKRFLLVLDDVWLEDYSRWETLQEALRNGDTGSKILVTTRKQEVAIMMGAATHQISLQKLTEEHCWLIFSQLAFMERTTEERTQLENIGRQIASKSSGLPLVAKTLGSQMRFRKPISQWEEILQSELWESGDVKVKEIFAPFLLSYYDLLPIEKRCFLYCSIFPKDRIIEKDELIELWMSQGYLGNNMSAKVKGVTCFETLAMRSFFQNFGVSLKYGDIVCKMHDIVHDFAQFLNGNECIVMEVDGAEETVKAVDESTRHLTLHVAAGTQTHFPDIRYNTKSLRTFFIESDRSFTLPDNILSFPHLTCLRTLKLSLCGVKKLPEDVGELKHLRYLDLSSNYHLAELPDSLFDICNLQTLKLSNCRSLGRLSEKIRKLVNLRNLHIYRSGLEGLPKGIGKLTGLQTLDMLVLPKDKESYFNLEDTKNLNYLPLDGFLCISKCANLGSLEEDEKIYLKSISENLAGLSLSFRNYSEMGPHFEEPKGVQDDVTILEGLQPHPNLKCLSIEFYLGATVYPKWMMSLVNLSTLRLESCKCKVLPPLGKFPSLEQLDIWIMSSMQKIGPELLGLTERDEKNGATRREDPSMSPTILFPKLKELRFLFNGKWKEWEGCETTIHYHGLTIMPCLDYLQISDCPSLETLPDFLQTTQLQYLDIEESKTLGEHCQKGGKEWLKISHVPNIAIDQKWVQRGGIWIQRDNGST